MVVQNFASDGGQAYHDRPHFVEARYDLAYHSTRVLFCGEPDACWQEYLHGTSYTPLVVSARSVRRFCLSEGPQRHRAIGLVLCLRSVYALEIVERNIANTIHQPGRRRVMCSLVELE